MVSQTNEQALEAAIERQLTGTCLEELKADATDINKVEEACLPFGSHHGYKLGYSKDYNAQFAIDEKKCWAFLEKTQEKQIEKLQRQSRGTDEWQRKILERLDRMIKIGRAHV